MKAFHRGALVLAAAAVGVGALAGCTASTEGTPTSSGSQPPSGSGGPAATGASGSPATDATLASVDPCSLMTTAEAAQVGGQGPGQVDSTAAAGSTSACGWHGRTSDDYAVSFGLDIRASQGIDELRANGGQITDGKVGARTARRLVNGTDCLVTLKVGPKSRVDVTVSIVGVTDSNAPCDVAGKVAGFVNPRLPPEHN